MDSGSRGTLAPDGLGTLTSPRFQTKGMPKSPTEIPDGGVAHEYHIS